MIEHAGCVARLHAGRWRGVLLVGPSGVGKSDLTLRLLERGWALVGDDRLHLWASGGRLYARAPEPLAGLIEARGLDVVAVRRRALAAVELLVDCLPPEVPLERIPAPERRSVADVALPRLGLHPLDASAAIKVELALARADFGRPDGSRPAGLGF